ncbi:hypothetical protein VKT23_013099 [Stygiomarasmius scandens]|uniref:Uncharacterized protein n=1 Tax=Marasmiellus scandens TaxID=2682957 RepID=A0ABR1J6Y0_9AGAR
MMTLFSSPSYTTMPRNRGYLFATDTRPTGRTVRMPAPFRLILFLSICDLFQIFLLNIFFRSLPMHPKPPPFPFGTSTFLSPSMMKFFRTFAVSTLVPI